MIQKLELAFGGYVLAEKEFKEWFDEENDLIFNKLVLIWVKNW